MYLLAYFRSDSNPGTRNASEALYYALSADGCQWFEQNRGAPIMRGEVGAKSLRDPCIMRAQDGGYHFFSTDDWASRHIVHASSRDLLHWSSQRLIPVMGSMPEARNCWAPECFYDREREAYRVIWSSSTTGANGEDDFNHRIWGCSTRDFVDFCPPELFFDPGYSVIDACVSWHAGSYLMAFKDERGVNHPRTTGKAIRVCRAPSATGAWSAPSELITPGLTEGPALFRCDGEWRMIFDHFMDGKFGVLRSADGLSWTGVREPTSFPARINHASVLEIDDITAGAIERFYG